MSLKDHKDIKTLILEDKTIYLVGTAHVSKSSVELVENAINEFQPDSVAVELCQSRFESLKDPEKWRKTDIITVIRQGKTYLLMAQLILSAFQKKIGNKLEVKPGAEMLKGIKLAEDRNIPIVLADREIKVTLKRAWASLSLWSTVKLVASVLGGLVSPQEIDEAEIERLKSGDVLNTMMAELGETLPGIRKSLIDERDTYLAAKIADAPGKIIVAVVGAGHVPGIEKNWGTKTDLTEISTEPPPSWFSKFFSWGILVAVLGMIVYGFFIGGTHTSVEMVVVWSVVTAALAGLGALAALAHPLTILSAAIAAPITTIHPFIAAGWVAGVVEALLRKPAVSDIENIGDDLLTIKGIWHNRLSHILIIVAFTNIGGMIGMFIAVPLVASLVS